MNANTDTNRNLARKGSQDIWLRLKMLAGTRILLGQSKKVAGIETLYLNAGGLK